MDELRKAHPETTSWHQDDRLYEVLMPMLFRDDRMEEAPGDVDAIVGLLGLEPGIPVVLVLPALDVDVGPQEVQQLQGRRLRADHHQAHAIQGGQALGPKLLRDQRPAGALVDHRVARDADDETVAQLGRVLEVADVAGVDDVEAAVAQDHRAALLLGGADDRLGLDEADDLLLGLHPLSIGTTSPSGHNLPRKDPSGGRDGAMLHPYRPRSGEACDR